MTGPVRSGDLLRLGRAASVQFRVPILFRVIRVHDWTTYDGWIWLDGYELDDSGEAVDRRSLFLSIAGIERAHPGAAPHRRREASRAGVMQQPHGNGPGGNGKPAQSGDGKARTMLTTTPYGARQAVEAAPLPVDLAAIEWDPDRQISVITEGGVTVPALKHSTGNTSTNTATQDNAQGSDKDSDRTED